MAPTPGSTTSPGTWRATRTSVAEPAGAWVRDKFVPELDRRMAADGHLVAPYGALRSVGGKREFFMEVFSPRYSRTSVRRRRTGRPCWWRRTA